MIFIVDVDPVTECNAPLPGERLAHQSARSAAGVVARRLDVRELLPVQVLRLKVVQHMKIESGHTPP